MNNADGEAARLLIKMQSGENTVLDRLGGHATRAQVRKKDAKGDRYTTYLSRKPLHNSAGAVRAADVRIRRGPG